MKILDTDFANLTYSDLINIISSESTPEDKIRRFRNVFSNLFRELTRNSGQHFSNLNSRMLYISDIYNADSNLMLELKGMRIFFNSIIHESLKISSQEFDIARSILWICNSVKYFSDTDIPEELKKIYDGKPNLTFKIFKPSLRETVDFISGTIVEVSPVSKSNQGNLFQRIAIKTDNEDLFYINLYGHWALSGRYLRKYSHINLFYLKKALNSENNFTAGNHSLIVLEPDFLLDASGIAECFSGKSSNYLLYFLNKFIASAVSENMLKGNVVNQVLDDFLTDPDFDFDESVKKSFRLNTLSSVSFTPDALIRIKNEIKATHFPNLNKFRDALENMEFRIEPSFISPYFGIQGRLDVLVFDKSNDKINVVELKSGQAPSGDLWINNKVQALIYHLLIKSVYSNVKAGSSSIFYSAAAKNPIRNVPNDPNLSVQIIDIRNEIVFNELAIASGNVSLLQNLNRTTFSGCPSFIVEKAELFEKNYTNLKPLVKKYFDTFVAFIFRELKTQKLGSGSEYFSSGYNSVWRKTPADKIESSSVLYGLKFSGSNAMHNSFIFEIPEGHPITSFRDNDICLLYTSNEGSAIPYKQEIFKCTIKNILSDSVEIVLRKKQFNPGFFINSDFVVLEYDFMDSGYYNQLQELLKFVSAPEDKINLLLTKKIPESSNYNYNNPNLNLNQNEIIRKALSALDYFLIQGPPGTGKTSTILVNIIKELTEKPASKDIAVLAFTNRAVNEICTQFRINNIDFLRIGDFQSEEPENFNFISQSLDYNEIKTLLSSKNVIVSTVHTFLSRSKDLSIFKNFGTIIIDEASQLIEPHVAGILSACDKFILIGDHKQLPAVTVQESSSSIVKDNELNDIGLYSCSGSLFERLFNFCENNSITSAYGTLEYHFRMHQDIAALIKPSYNITLKTGNNTQNNQESAFSEYSEDPFEKAMSKSRTIFIPSPLTDENKISLNEAEKVNGFSKAVFNVYKNEFSSKTLGIITPWKKQISLIRKIIEDKDILKNTTIDTIERFQGSEKDIIIFSLAVFNPYQLNLISSITKDNLTDRKLNVAVSRAKNHLIILGCEQILRKSRHYSSMINQIIKSNGYIAL